MLAAHRPQLVRFFTGRTGSAAEAEDVVQEIWLHIAAPAAGPIGNPLGYLHRVGMNIVLDRVRARARRERRDAGYVEATTSVLGVEAIDDRPSAFDAVVGRERIERLAAALAGLAGVDVAHFWLALTLLGLGWNFGFVGASAMVLECHRPEERARVQSFNDFVVFGTMAVGSFLSGGLLTAYGWSTVLQLSFVPLAVAVAALAIASATQPGRPAG